MRTILTLSLLALASPAVAQANNWAGFSVTSAGISPATNSARDIQCGSAFSCTPMPLAGRLGDTVSAFVMGTMNGFFLIAGTVDTPNLGCLSLGLPDIINDLILPPAPLFVISVGVCSVPDNGRCNGGASPLSPLFTIPTSLGPGAIALQALVSTPLRAGGTGLALTRAVELQFN